MILLAGVAGLVAGAGSMAAGEWVSVRSQRELYEHELAVERWELEQFPDDEQRELIYEAKGLDPEAAKALTAQITVPIGTHPAGRRDHPRPGAAGRRRLAAHRWGGAGRGQRPHARPAEAVHRRLRARLIVLGVAVRHNPDVPAPATRTRAPDA